MEHILITGGEGFLGKHLQIYLNEHGITYDTLDLDVKASHIVDITKPLQVEAIGQGYTRVIHLAGVLGTHELFDDVHEAIDVNIKGTVNVLNYCRETGADFSGITMAHVWKNPYETTKLAAERLAEAWAREYDINVNYTTVYNAYGEYQAHGEGHPQKIIPTFARALYEGKPIPIWGDGKQIVDLIYAGDVAEALYLKKKEAGTGVGHSVIDVAHAVSSIVLGADPFKVEFLPMRRGEHTPAREPVAIQPSHPLAEGMWDWTRLIDTVKWYEKA